MTASCPTSAGDVAEREPVDRCADYVARLVASAPPFSGDQRSRLAVLLQSASAEDSIRHASA